MYNVSKDEIIVTILLCIFMFVNLISKDYQVDILSNELSLLVLVVASSYLFFNRIVKLIFKRKKNDFYCTTALIQTLKFKGAGRAGYVCYVIDYEDENNNLHTKELHTFCSIKSLKPGDKIKINVDRNNPDNIIVVDSDLLIAITICAAGIAFESFIIISYISVC
ncbi:MAG: hypothetical protein E7499_02175 [Ruminococcus sp.]|nr:hypothetical protein [Ruminococcus sp.]